MSRGAQAGWANAGLTRLARGGRVQFPLGECALLANVWRRCRAAKRAPALGGSLYRCGDCGALEYAYHSCRNRHCPTCQDDRAQAWLERLRTRLLPCDHFLLTFTLPSELRAVARSHQESVYAMLLREAAAAVHRSPPIAPGSAARSASWRSSTPGRARWSTIRMRTCSSPRAGSRPMGPRGSSRRTPVSHAGERPVDDLSREDARRDGPGRRGQRGGSPRVEASLDGPRATDRPRRPRGARPLALCLSRRAHQPPAGNGLPMPASPFGTPSRAPTRHGA